VCRDSHLIMRSIRVPISIGKFKVLDESGKTVGECYSVLVPRDLFPNAIWMNDGRYYRSKKINYEGRIVAVQALDDRTDHYTIAMPNTQLKCDEGVAKLRSSAGCLVGRGVVTVTRDVRLYKEVPFASEAKESETVKATKTRPIEYDSTAFWLDIPRDKLIVWGVKPDKARASLHALEHAIRSVFPIVADVDPNDLGSTLEVTDPNDRQFKCRLYLFDTFAGGTGLSEFAFEKPRLLLDAAEELLSTCKCKTVEGCPRCSIVAWCEYRNEELFKPGALKLLNGMRDLR